MIAFLLALAAVAVPADTSQCAKVAPVSTSIDVVALQVDADCFGAAAASDRAGRDALSKAATAAAASQKLRLDRIVYVKAHPPAPPPPPPPPATKTCPDGSVILATATCPAPLPPPPPPPVDCGNGVTVPAGQACPPPPMPMPMPAPQPGGWVPASSIVPQATLDFDPLLAKQAAGVPGAGASLDVIGAFRFICGPGQVLADDPVVYPGQPGRSHLHQFYGNTAANAYSDYKSLRTTGDSTCNSDGRGHALNRSAYWMPALLDGNGNVVRPDYAVVYYKRHPKGSKVCTDRTFTAGCVAIPNGLRMIAGRDMLNLKAPPTGNFHFSCTQASGATKGAFSTMAAALAVCSAGWQLSFSIDFPDCWNAKDIDSPDHRSHVAYAVSDPRTLGGRRCPSGYVLMPSFKLTVPYTIVAGDDTSKWHLSCALAGEDSGLCLHADYDEGWDLKEKQDWTDNCIDGLVPVDPERYRNKTTGVMPDTGLPVGFAPRSCQSGNEGSGFALKGASAPPQGFSAPANPRLVPLAQVPVTP
jgi:hypothetical protein